MDSKVGRFISRDPIREINFYTYVKNNPLDGVDPFGLKWYTIGKKLGGIVTALWIFYDAYKDLRDAKKYLESEQFLEDIADAANEKAGEYEYSGPRPYDCYGWSGILASQRYRNYLALQDAKNKGYLIIYNENGRVKVIITIAGGFCTNSASFSLSSFSRSDYADGYCDSAIGFETAFR